MTTSHRTQKICLLGMLIGLAMILSYLETLVPISIGIPGVKLGLANLVTIVVLYNLDIPSAVLVSVIRIVLSAVLFSNMSMLLYSMSGAVLSLVVMVCFMRIPAFSSTGVSVAGAVAHNIGQLLVAWFFIDSYNVFYYMPVLIIAGVIAGGLIGFLAASVIKKTKALLCYHSYDKE